jgi:hypothetical protein
MVTGARISIEFIQFILHFIQQAAAAHDGKRFLSAEVPVGLEGAHPPQLASALQ